MSRITEHGLGQDEVSTATQRPWEKLASADDIVDPIDGIVDPVDAETINARELDAGRDQSVEEEEDVPLDVKFTDALAMLADGGHDYGSRPIIDEELDGASSGEDRAVDLSEIDESSKDA